VDGIHQGIHYGFLVIESGWMGNSHLPDSVRGPSVPSCRWLATTVRGGTAIPEQWTIAIPVVSSMGHNGTTKVDFFWCPLWVIAALVCAPSAGQSCARYHRVHTTGLVVSDDVGLRRERASYRDPCVCLKGYQGTARGRVLTLPGRRGGSGWRRRIAATYFQDTHALWPRVCVAQVDDARAPKPLNFLEPGSSRQKH